jgi:uncharacterized protein with HEPN domain
MNENRLPNYLEGMSREEFLDDKRTQQAVILNIIILGEAATKLLKDYDLLLDLYPDVPWRSMRACVIESRMATSTSTLMWSGRQHKQHCRICCRSCR